MRWTNTTKSSLAAGCAIAALAALPTAASAQEEETVQAATPTGAEIVDESDGSNTGTIVVTGSRIRQDPNDSALPLQILNSEDLLREGIDSPEQLISFLSTNGNGPDNLASNTDVVGGAQRGTNGLSAANLRGQGSASTLVLLNGRRVAAHGLQGSAVDVNQIPFAAIERVEVLKDGASAIYGTDAIGGVINFITKNDFQGVALEGFTDITERGDSPIYRLSGTVGYGDVSEQGFNVMASVSKSWRGILRGDDRDFVNGDQPDRGLSIDTRGTPIATAFANGANAIFAPDGSLLSGVDLTIPGTTTQANGGINYLDLPGGEGCTSFDGGMAYDAELWANAPATFACAWDTGRAAILQQPLETLTYYSRATLALGAHQISAEFTGSDADSSKQFSSNQYAGNTSTTPLYYPLNSLTEDTYNFVYNRLVEFFPSIAANYGKPISYRWRCTVCGPREYKTNSKTLRAALALEGPLGGSWDYRAGASYARSKATSVLGSGYAYRGIFSSQAAADASGIPGAVRGGIDPRAPTAPGATAPGIVGLLNSGILNPFSIEQTPEALAALESISADGVTLYGGQYEVKQIDASVSGSLFELPGGMVQVAMGVDFRRETYSFNGSAAAELDRPEIFNVAFDNINALTPKSRNVKAAYAEVLIPVFDMLELTAAGRVDDYTGFGTTFNPKFTAKFRPAEWLMFRGSYNTGFRVPTFNQIFNGVTQSPNPGNTLVDPTRCPSGAVDPSIPGCEAITPDTLTGGNLELGPETSEQYSVGVVFQPAPMFSATVDFWSIAVDDTIGALSIRQLLDNASYFEDRITRDATGTITLLDLTSDNIGSRRTKGIEVTLRGGFDVGEGQILAGLDGTYLVQKKEKFLPSAPYGESLIGLFTFAGDLGLEWKHNAFVSYSTDTFNVSLSQIFRKGYDNYALPGIANGTVTRPNYNEKVDDYIIYNLSVGVKINDQFRLTGGVKNLFDTDPPFAITYDSNFGSGSSWEPRVADPRGRSFTLSAEAKF